MSNAGMWFRDGPIQMHTRGQTRTRVRAHRIAEPASPETVLDGAAAADAAHVRKTAANTGTALRIERAGVCWGSRTAVANMVGSKSSRALAQ